MLDRLRVLALGVLLFILLAVTPTVAVAAECEWATIEVRDLTKCEWQQLTGTPGDVDLCAPVTLTGTKGPDRLSGNGGNDVLVGRRGDDVLRGDGGDDIIRGGGGNDEIHGGPGSDELSGGKGDDTFTGGHGGDRFVFSAPGAKGDKIITDFDPCTGDRIVLYSNEPGLWPPVAEILASEVQEPVGFTVYTLRHGLTVETDVPLGTDDFVVKEGDSVVE